MAMVITVAQQKGGAGKTTLAANLATALAPTSRVCLVDIDKQRSLTAWHRLRPANLPVITFLELSFWRLDAEIARLRAGADYIFIDSPPQIDTDARTAIRVADLVLVPLQPSPVDLWATDATLRLAAAEQRPAALVLNRVPANSRLTDTIRQACAAAGHRLLPTTLGNRTVLAQAFAQGMGACEFAPKSPAAAEIAALAACLSAPAGIRD